MDEDIYATLPSPLILTPADILSSYQTVNVLAPLVRCSKLPFRHLCSLYETHITHTPMILAEEFSRAQVARISDFSSSVNERGVFWMERRAKTGSGSRTKPRLEEDPDNNSDPTRSASTDDDQLKTRLNTRTNNNNRLPHSPTPPTHSSDLVRGLLLAQLASPNSASLADASELLSPYVDGVDINCGCPQKWAYHEGIGCALLRKPELVADMIRTTKDRLGWGNPVSIKIRIDPEEA